jgi:hypothetical protein
MRTSLDTITIRRANPAEAAVARLAQLDSAPAPAGELLAAEVDGELRAAVSLTDGSAIADPFERTVELVELLRAQVKSQVPRGRAALASRVRHPVVGTR